MRETGEREGRSKASRQKETLLISKKVPDYSDGWDLKTVPQPSKITKELELITITRGAIQEYTKIIVEKSKKVKKHEQWRKKWEFAGCKFLHCNLRNFEGYENLATLLLFFLLLSALQL